MKKTIAILYLFLIFCASNLIYGEFVGLNAYYALDGNASDSSGNSLHGSVYGATQISDRFGAAGSAYSFDGVNDYIALPYSGLLFPSQYSFSAWVKLNAYSADGNTGSIIFSNYGGLKGSIFYISNTGKASLRPHGGGTCVDVRSTSSVALNVWTHIAGTYDGTNVKIFVNGAQEDSVTFTGYEAVAASPTLARASWYDGSYSQIMLDDVKIYNRALSASEIVSFVPEFSTLFFTILPVIFIFFKKIKR